MISYHRKQRIQFLHIRNAIKTRQISQQHLIYNIVANKLSRVFLHSGRKSHLRITAIIDIVEEETVQLINIYRTIDIALYPIPFHLGLAHQMLIFLKMDIFEEKQRRQIEIGKPARSAFVAALFQCRSSRTGSHKLHVVISIYQGFQIDFPVFEILYLVEENIKFFLAVFLIQYLFCQRKQLLQEDIIINRGFHRNIGDILRRYALVYQPLDGMIEHHRLTHSARSHQDEGTLNADILYQWIEDVEIEARTHLLIVRRYPALRPPRVVYLQPT